MDNDLFDEGVREKTMVLYEAFGYLEGCARNGMAPATATVNGYAEKLKAGEEKCRRAICDEVA